MDEPENGIHPSALETVSQSLSLVSSVSSVYGDQVLPATHALAVPGLAEPDTMPDFVRDGVAPSSPGRSPPVIVPGAELGRGR